MQPRIDALPLPRRKLFDACMRSFVVGNTTPTPLAPLDDPTTQRARVLYAASGDCRNALETVGAWRLPDLEVTLNDGNVVVCARNAIILRLLRRPDVAAADVARVWCDAWLSAAAAAALDRELRAVVDELDARGRLAGAVALDDGCGAGACCRAWLERRARPGGAAAFAAARDAAMALAGAGRGRRDAGAAWRAHGCCGGDGAELRALGLANETLRDPGPAAAFLETQGPGGALGTAAAVGTAAFRADAARAWARLGAFANEPGARFAVSSRDCCAPRSWPARSFDAVDTSNVADYAGLWNLLLACGPLVNDGGYAQTEHALTVAADARAVLLEELPYDAWAHSFLLASVGWEMAGAHTTDGDERVTRLRWRRAAAAAAPRDCRRRDAAAKAKRRETFRSVLAQLLLRVAPIPMHPDFFASAEAPVEGSYAFPKSTAATVVHVAARSASRAATGCLDALLAELGGAAVARNLRVALEAEMLLERRALRLAAPRFRFRNRAFLRAATFAVAPRSGDLAAPRGGVHEPALGVALLRDDAVLRDALDVDGKWEIDGEGAVVNLLYELFCDLEADELQLLDRVAFDPATNRLTLLLPSDLAGFSRAVLLDVQRFAVIAEPLSLDL